MIEAACFICYLLYQHTLLCYTNCNQTQQWGTCPCQGWKDPSWHRLLPPACKRIISGFRVYTSQQRMVERGNCGGWKVISLLYLICSSCCCTWGNAAALQLLFSSKPSILQLPSVLYCTYYLSSKHRATLNVILLSFSLCPTLIIFCFFMTGTPQHGQLQYLVKSPFQLHSF